MIDIYASGPESEVAKNTVFSKRRWLLKFLMLRWWCAVLVLVEEVTNSSISSSTGGNFYEPLRGSFSGSDKPADPQKIFGVTILSTCIHTHSSHSSHSPHLISPHHSPLFSHLLVHVQITALLSFSYLFLFLCWIRVLLSCSHVGW